MYDSNFLSHSSINPGIKYLLLWLTGPHDALSSIRFFARCQWTVQFFSALFASENRAWRAAHRHSRVAPITFGSSVSLSGDFERASISISNYISTQIFTQLFSQLFFFFFSFTFVLTHWTFYALTVTSLAHCPTFFLSMVEPQRQRPSGYVRHIKWKEEVYTVLSIPLKSDIKPRTKTSREVVKENWVTMLEN